MLEYLGLSGFEPAEWFDETGSVFAELADEPWFWPGACALLVVMVMLIRRR